MGILFCSEVVKASQLTDFYDMDNRKLENIAKI